MAGRSTWPTGSSRSTRTGGSPSVGAGGRSAPAALPPTSIDLRPWVVLPGMVDLHAHLPQVPNAGLGYALPLLDWLDRLTFPTERVVGRPGRRRAARAGDLPGLRGGRHDDGPRLRRRLRGRDGRRVPGRRGPRDPGDPRQGDDGSADLRRDDRAGDDPRADAPRERATWPSAGTGRRRAGSATPSRRGSPCRARPSSCAASASLARDLGCWWQSHVSEDSGEIAEVGPAVPGGPRLRRRLRPGGRARAALRPRPRDPPVAARGGATGRDRRPRSPIARPRTCSSAPG